MTYKEKLLDPRWQRKRLEILDRDDFTCQFCVEKNSTLHVHHKNYIWDNDPWNYENSNFITLCQECHKLEQTAKDELKLMINNMQKDGIPILHILEDFKTKIYLKHNFHG
jgi:5-methylcytosine-specific restriction endonuclease McrA